MGRYPCCKESADLKKGPWTKEEDEKLANYIHENGIGNWQLVAKRAGLNRCGKSCRLRWTNYLRPDIKRGSFSEEEEKMIIDLHKELGNRWSKIAARLSAGRTDNEVKNYYNTHIKKKLTKLGIDPITHKPFPNLNHLLNSLPNNISFNNNPIISPLDALRLQANITQIANIQLLQNIVQILNYNKNPLPLVQNSVPMMLDNVTTFDNFNVGPNKPHLFDQPFSTTPNSYSVESLLNQPSSMSNSLEFGRGDRNLIVSRILTSNIYNEDDGMMLHSSLPPLVPATPETSNSLEFSHEDKNLVPRVLTSDISNGDDGMMLHSSIPSLVPVTPETSNSEQMFSRGVMKCGDGDGDGDYDFSAWEKVFGDEGNTSLLESIFQS